MKHIEQHRWRILWAGKWKTTSYHASEEDIRVEHPEAEQVEGTLRVLEVPETDGERAAAMRASTSSAWRG
jgi:hypothetical protein